MDILDNIGLSATTVVVDVDTMADELKRLKDKGKTSFVDSRFRGNDDQIVDSRFRGNDTGKPVHRPSWGGRFPRSRNPKNATCCRGSGAGDR